MKLSRTRACKADRRPLFRRLFNSSRGYFICWDWTVETNDPANYPDPPEGTHYLPREFFGPNDSGMSYCSESEALADLMAWLNGTARVTPSPLLPA